MLRSGEACVEVRLLGARLQTWLDTLQQAPVSCIWASVEDLEPVVYISQKCWWENGVDLVGLMFILYIFTWRRSGNINSFFGPLAFSTPPHATPTKRAFPPAACKHRTTQVTFSFANGYAVSQVDKYERDGWSKAWGLDADRQPSTERFSVSFIGDDAADNVDDNWYSVVSLFQFRIAIASITWKRFFLTRQPFSS